MDWSWVIAIVVILGFILALWAKVSGQTISELLSDLIDLVKDKGE